MCNVRRKHAANMPQTFRKHACNIIIEPKKVIIIKMNNGTTKKYQKILYQLFASGFYNINQQYIISYILSLFVNILVNNQ